MKKTVNIVGDWLRLWVGFVFFVALETAMVYGLLRFFGAI